MEPNHPSGSCVWRDITYRFAEVTRTWGGALTGWRYRATNGAYLWFGVPADREAWSHNWKCESSPTGSCLYDREQDPAQDHCVFCHNPYERK